MEKDLHERLGRLTLAWTSLDVVLRLALKRLKGLSTAPRDPYKEKTDRIFGKLNHSKLITELEKAVAVNPVAGLKPLIELIGASRSGTGLYARRNEIVHSLWLTTPDGKTFQQRIGDENWRKPLEIRNADIDALTREILKVRNDMDKLTR